MNMIEKPGQQTPDVETIFRDSPQRSLLKTITYRIFASGAMFVGVFIYSHEYQSLSIGESVGNAGFIAVLEFGVKLVIYYIHERIWSGISWGKYWKRHYWARLAWKRAYRKAHK
ncbi:MAG: DUF2061 domain-containing protein [Bacteroidota bacterium]